ncbi:MAG: hypothetical protein GX942_05705 [Papillibacter sp.]|nr:hypothetical protein [Papillibacter sp.]
MEISVSFQGLQALISFACGPVLGLLYDLLASLRKKLGLNRLIYLFDTVFCVTAACLIFLLGNVAGLGELRLFMPLIMGLGALLYFLLLRKPGAALADIIISLFAVIIKFILLPFRLILFSIKKTLLFFKNIFSYLHKWFKIRYKVFMPIYTARSVLEDVNENQTLKYTYNNGNNSAADIRVGIPGTGTGPNRRGHSSKSRS